MKRCPRCKHPLLPEHKSRDEGCTFRHKRGDLRGVICGCPGPDTDK